MVNSKPTTISKPPQVPVESDSIPHDLGISTSTQAGSRSTRPTPYGSREESPETAINSGTVPRKISHDGQSMSAMIREQQLARERAGQRPLHAHFRTAQPQTYLQRSHKGRQARRQSRMDSSGQELRRSVLSLCTLHDYPNSRDAHPVRHSKSTRPSASDTQEIV